MVLRGRLRQNLPGSQPAGRWQARILTRTGGTGAMPPHQGHHRSPGLDTEGPAPGRRRIKAARAFLLMIMTTLCLLIANLGLLTNLDTTTSLQGPSWASP